MSKKEIGRRPLLAAGAAAGVSAVLPSLSIAQIRPEGSGMAGDLTAEEIVRLLDLQPNATCGFVRVTFLSKQAIAPGALPAPFADGRPLGSALYFLVTPRAPVRLHRIRNDQLYHYYLGDPPNSRRRRNLRRQREVLSRFHAPERTTRDANLLCVMIVVHERRGWCLWN
jgi:Cupin superfamily (DUF985)